MADTARVLQVNTVAGNIAALGPGQFITDDRTAKSNHWTVGSTASFQLARGEPKQLTLVGIYKASGVISGTAISWQDALTGFRSPLPAVAYIKLKPGANVAAAEKKVDALLATSPEVNVQTRAAYLGQVTALFNGLLAGVQVLLGVAMLIAFLGIINTLMLSIIERTRELGLLRAIGLRRGQAAWMITVESIVISVFGAVLGIIVGAALGAAVMQALKDQGFNKLALPWSLMITYVIASVIVGAVAATIPAARAARLNVLNAIAYE
jgi:putative ABC transport system permease protein